MSKDMAADTVQIGIAIVQLLGAYVLACFVGAGGGVLIAKTYLTEKIKSAIKSEYDEKLETLKADLKANNDAELEKLKAQLKAQGDIAIETFKSDLAVAAAQRNVEFSHLHLKRAEIIASVYADLRDATDAIADYTKAFEPVGGTSREARGKKAVEATNKFIRTFRLNEIYLPGEAAEKVRAIADELKFAFFQFFYGVDLGGDLGPDKTQKWHAIQAKVERLAGPATAELQKDFRTLLGYAPLAHSSELENSRVPE
jgi:tetratricopeptide (TPR) repeat protein